jgi:hypothetical protein
MNFNFFKKQKKVTPKITDSIGFSSSFVEALKNREELTEYIATISSKEPVKYTIIELINFINSSGYKIVLIDARQRGYTFAGICFFISKYDDDNTILLNLIKIKHAIKIKIKTQSFLERPFIKDVEEIINQHQNQNKSPKKYIDSEFIQLIHEAVNDSHLSSNRITQPNSNNCAEFVNNWLANKQIIEITKQQK